jgi:heme/copper-type cytochrome/quinol oxidase subunit 4
MDTTAPVEPQDHEELLRRTNQLLGELDSDRQKAKAKEAAEAWTKTAAVTLVFVAVLTALAVQKSGSYGSRSMKHVNQSIFLQVKATDQWSFFQSKSTKSHVYEMGSDVIETLGDNGDAEKKALASMAAKHQKYEKEKDDIKKDAEDFEKQRDDERHLAEDNASLGGKLGNSVLGFQIAIALSSIGLVMKKKPLWFVSLTMATIATGWMVWCLMHAPPA